jgi:hypothetical protein
MSDSNDDIPNVVEIIEHELEQLSLSTMDEWSDEPEDQPPLQSMAMIELEHKLDQFTW